MSAHAPTAAEIKKMWKEADIKLPSTVALEQNLAEHLNSKVIQKIISSPQTPTPAD